MGYPFFVKMSDKVVAPYGKLFKMYTVITTCFKYKKRIILNGFYINIALLTPKGPEALHRG